jgi:hypothetical protein
MIPTNRILKRSAAKKSKNERPVDFDELIPCLPVLPVPNAGQQALTGRLGIVHGHSSGDKNAGYGRDLTGLHGLLWLRLYWRIPEFAQSVLRTRERGGLLPNFIF